MTERNQLPSEDADPNQENNRRNILKDDCNAGRIDDALLESVNKNWRNQAFPALLAERTTAADYAGRDLDARQADWVYRKKELSKFEQIIGGWEVFQQEEMRKHPSTMDFPNRNHAWATDLRAREDQTPPENDWTWLSSILSSPAAFRQEQFWQYRGKHIAVFNRKVWAANERASVAEEEAIRAIRDVKPEMATFTSNHQIVLYFLG